MTGFDYLVGLLLFTATTGSAALGAVLLLRRRLGHLNGIPRLVAVGLLATAAVIAVHLVPGAMGVLAPWTALACAALLAVAVTRLPTVQAERERLPPAVEEGVLSRGAAAVAVGAVGIAAVSAAWTQSAVPATFNTDTLTFHLPNIARWIQTGSLWQVDQFVPLLAQGNYPHNGDLVFLAAVLPWENDAFVRLVNWPVYAFLGLSVYAIARELSTPPAAAALLSAAFLATPAVVRTASAGAMTDTVLLAALGGGVLFVLRHVRTGRRSDLVLAGLGLGVAFGTKWYGVPAVAVLLIVWAAGWLVRGRAWRAVARQGAALGSLVAGAGGFWLLRNLVESGNPLFPQRVELAGVTLFDAPRDVIRDRFDHTIADYALDWQVLGDGILPQWREFLALPGMLALLGIAAGTVAGLAWLRRGGDARAFALAVAGALLLGAYAITPYSALGLEGRPLLVGENARYALPALLLGCALAARVAGSLARLRPAADLVALAAVADGLTGGHHLAASTIALVAVLLAVAAGLAYAVMRTAQVLAGRRARAFRLAALGMATVALVLVGYSRQRDFNEERYANVDAALDWVTRNAPEGQRIGLAGRWDQDGISPVLPLFGPRLGNRVAYVGEFRDDLLREHRTQQEFAAAVERGRYDLVLVGRGRPPRAVSSTQRWVRAEGFELVARSRRLALYRAPR